MTMNLKMMKNIWVLFCAFFSLVFALASVAHAQDTLADLKKLRSVAEWRAEGAIPAIIAAVGPNVETYRSNFAALTAAAANLGPRELVLSSGETFIIDPTNAEQALLEIISNKINLKELYANDKANFIRMAMLNDWMWARFRRYVASQLWPLRERQDYNDQLQLGIMTDPQILWLRDIERDAFATMLYEASDMIHRDHEGIPAKAQYENLLPETCGRKGLC